MIDFGLTFNEVHSYNDLNLILNDMNISPAIPKTNYIDIPGGNGTLDLTNAFGEVKYNDRDAKFVFTIHPKDDFEAKKTQVSNLLNGLLCKIVLDEDQGYYYYGRCTVSEYPVVSYRNRQIVISAKLQPYKMKCNETIVDVALSNEEQEIVINNGRKSVVPEVFIANDNTVIKFGDKEHFLNAGIHKILDIQFKYGENKLIVSGEGVMTFRFREGDL